MQTTHPLRMAAALALSFTANTPATAATFATIYRFTGGADGAAPAGELTVRGTTLYGAASGGGALGFGAIYQLDASTNIPSVLYSFKGGTGDGIAPSGPLLFSGGTLFGTTYGGGRQGCYTTPGTCGTVFRLNIASKTETLLHAFANHNRDGGIPSSNLVNVEGTLFGATAEGQGPGFHGCNDGCGTIYKLRSSGAREQVLYSFTGNGPDGSYPIGHLAYGGGQIYGAAMNSGGSGCNIGGSVFRIDVATGTQTTLHSFPGCTNGGPSGGVILANGMLYGTTQGTGQTNGSIFQVDPASGAFTLLYSFKGGADGGGPTGKLLYDGGALYGTTPAVHAGGGGTVFKFDLATGLETVLHSFTDFAGGFYPYAGLTKIGDRLYGTTTLGGLASTGSCCGNGTIFVITP